MDFEPISDAIYQVLMRQGLRGETAGTVEPRGIKGPASAGEALNGASKTERGGKVRRSTAGGGAPADLGVEKAIEAAMKNGTGRIVRCVPFLMIVLDGGRK